MWRRIARDENDLERQRRTKKFIQEREATMIADPQLMRKPVMEPGVETPTDEERERHECIHLPSAPWCEICVRSKSHGTPRPHFLAPMHDREAPSACLDFGSMAAESETPGTKAAAFATTLILVENKSGYPVAYSAEPKGGPSHAY